jgi:ABC-type transport system involved in multi-copper enzyme maturation permease subunit
LTAILSIAAVFVVDGYGTSSLAPLFVMGGWLIIYAAVWTAVTVGYSAAFESEYRTLGALVATYVTFSFDFGVWSAVVRPAFALVFTGSLDPPAYDSLGAAPLWLQVTERLNPLVNFWQAMQYSVELVGPGSTAGGPLPHAIGTVLFLSFGALVLVWGNHRFGRVDLEGQTGGLDVGDRLWRVFHSVATRLPAGSTGGTGAENRIRTIAGADRRHALQNWVVVVGLAVTLLLVVPNLWQSIRPSSVSKTADQFVDLVDTFTLPVLVLGIALGYGAVAGERAGGTVRFVLSHPATRRDLVFGKLRSRLTLVAGTLFVAILVAELLVTTRIGGLYPAALLAWGSYVLLFGTVWTSVVVGLSAATSSRYQTLAAASLTYLLFSTGIGLWNLVVRPGFTFVFTGSTEWDDYAFAADGGPLWFRYIDHLNPFVALDTIREGLLIVAGYGTEFADATAPLVCYSLLVVALFAGAPVFVGYRQFERADL